MGGKDQEEMLLCVDAHTKEILGGKGEVPLFDFVQDCKERKVIFKLRSYFSINSLILYRTVKKGR